MLCTRHINFIELFFLTCYAPTDEAEEEVKEDFYNRLHAATNTPIHNIILVLKDFKDREGSKNEESGRTMGKQGLLDLTHNNMWKKMSL